MDQVVQKEHKYVWWRYCSIIVFAFLLGIASFMIPMGSADRTEENNGDGRGCHCELLKQYYGFPLHFKNVTESRDLNGSSASLLIKEAFAQVQINDLENSCLPGCVSSPGNIDYLFFLVNIGIYGISFLFVDYLAWHQKKRAYYVLIPVVLITLYLLAFILPQPIATEAVGFL